MEDEKIIDLYWNRDQGAIGHTQRNTAVIVAGLRKIFF